MASMAAPRCRPPPRAPWCRPPRPPLSCRAWVPPTLDSKSSTETRWNPEHHHHRALTLLWTGTVAKRTHFTVALGLNWPVTTVTMCHTSDKRPWRQRLMNSVVTGESWCQLRPSLLRSTIVMDNDDVSMPITTVPIAVMSHADVINACHYYAWRWSVARLFTEQSCTPLWNGWRWLHINRRWLPRTKLF
jgi:hypothetical protein